jgi:hypothetical protein
VSSRAIAGRIDGGFSNYFLHFFISQGDDLTGAFGTTNGMTARVREIIFCCVFQINRIAKTEQDLNHDLFVTVLYIRHKR